MKNNNLRRPDKQKSHEGLWKQGFYSLSNLLNKTSSLFPIIIYNTTFTSNKPQSALSFSANSALGKCYWQGLW